MNEGWPGDPFDHDPGHDPTSDLTHDPGHDPVHDPAHDLGPDPVSDPIADGSHDPGGWPHPDDLHDDHPGEAPESGHLAEPGHADVAPLDEHGPADTGHPAELDHADHPDHAELPDALPQHLDTAPFPPHLDIDVVPTDGLDWVSPHLLGDPAPAYLPATDHPAALHDLRTAEGADPAASDDPAIRALALFWSR